MPGRMIHSSTGSLTFQPYGKNEAESIHSVARADLNLALIQAAEGCSSVRMTFEKKCTGMDLNTGVLQLSDPATGESSSIASKVVIGADGAFSAIRAEMQKLDRFNYRQDYLTHGYKELTMPAGPGGTFRMEKHALHIWPRHSFMMIALPNLDGSFTCTLFWPLEGSNSFAAWTSADVQRYFQDQFPDVPTDAESGGRLSRESTGPLVTIRCNPWHVGDRVVLLGDAAHAVVPFLGQGMNAAFEDCTVLYQCLREDADPAAAFRQFESLRKQHADVLADLCIANYLEMRDLVSSRTFLLKKKLDILLNRLFPRWYIPLYSLVSFTRTPYADALRRAQRQDRLVRLLAALFALSILFIAVRLIAALAFLAEGITHGTQ